MKKVSDRQLKRLLKRLYTSASSPACYAGVDALWREARKHDSRIRRREVVEFLANERTYTLHRRIVRRFKRLPTLAPGMHTHWQADLCDMQKLAAYNDGYAYILVCIDTLSRQLFAAPMRRKCAEEMIAAFTSIFKRVGAGIGGVLPWRILTDEGREFIAHRVQEFFRANEIQHFCMYTSPQFHAGIVERANRTLKERLYRHFTEHNSARWLGVLQSIVNAINHSVNTGIGVAPADVNFSNAIELRDRLAKRARRVPTPLTTLRIGDIVRIEARKHAFVKGYLPRFSNELFVVVDVRATLRPVTYRIANTDGERLRGWYYAQDLCRVGAEQRRVFGTAENHEADGDEDAEEFEHQPLTYPIQRVIRTRQDARGRTQALVKWFGRSAAYNSWVDSREIVR